MKCHVCRNGRHSVCMYGIICNFIYSTLKEVNRWDQFDLDTILINGDALYKSVRRQTLLTVEDLPRDFNMGEGTVFVQFRENKYGIFNWGLREVHATLLENLVQNPEC